VRHAAKCFVLAVGVMLMVASATEQQFHLMEASIISRLFTPSIQTL
jgi:hypothetical protein